jgi:hypothetical protein
MFSGSGSLFLIRIRIQDPDNCTIIWEKGHLKHIQQAGRDDDEEGPPGKNLNIKPSGFPDPDPYSYSGSGSRIQIIAL